MNYRIATTADYAAIAQYVNNKDTFIPVVPHTLGGHWLVADEDGKIRGTVWFFGEAPNAYVDYWTADGPVTATNLLNCLRMQLRVDKVQHVYGTIHMANQPALRLAEGAFGTLAAGPYALIYKDLTDGIKEDNEHHGDTGCESGRVAVAAVAGGRGG